MRMGEMSRFLAAAKKVVVMVLLGAMLCWLPSCRGPAETEDRFGLLLAGGDGAPGVRINSVPLDGGEYWLFLPADAYHSETEIRCPASGQVLVEGVAVRNGDANRVITRDGTYEVVCGDDTFTLHVLSSAGLPALFLETASGSLDAIHADREWQEAGTLRVLENGVLSRSFALNGVRGRGHTTWEFDKKPYNLKFAEAAPLLGMAAAKKWCLLANAADPSLIRTDIAFSLAREVGVKYACRGRHADLYINGDYMGNYFVSEAVQAAPGRVEITDLDSLNEAANPGVDLSRLPSLSSGETGAPGSRRWTGLPASPRDVSGGYLLEYDEQSSCEREPNGFVTPGGQCVTVKSPDPVSEAEIDYIAGYVGAAEAALYSENGYNDEGRHYSDYYDVDSLARMYVLNEYLLNISLGCSSTFFFKDAGGKLTAGPAWDFDECFDNSYTRLFSFMNRADGRSLIQSVCNGDTLLPTVYAQMYRQESFYHAVASVWQSCAAAFDAEHVRGLIDGAAGENLRSAVCNAVRWSKAASPSPEALEALYLERSVAALYPLVEARSAYAAREFTGEPALLVYDGGEGKCLLSENAPSYRGDSLTVKSISDSPLLMFLAPSAPGARFRSWNTEADGSGESYQPGDPIRLDKYCTTLYAQWDSGGS